MSVGTMIVAATEMSVSKAGFLASVIVTLLALVWACLWRHDVRIGFLAIGLFCATAVGSNDGQTWHLSAIGVVLITMILFVVTEIRRTREASDPSPNDR